MANEQAATAMVPDVEKVGAAFVNHYYNVLVLAPQSQYKFYKDCSIVGRPDASGQMLSVTTVNGITQLVNSPHYSVLEVVIKTADSLASYNNGVLVLVSGSITYKNSDTRAFIQSFLLVPQERGYFVFNDVVRYLDEEPQRQKQNLQETAKAYPVSVPVVKPEGVAQNGVIEKPTTVLQDPDHREVPEDSAGQKVSEVEHAHSGVPPHPQETPVEVQARQKSYASIIKQNAAPPTVAIQKSSLMTGRAIPNLAQRLATAPNSNPVNFIDKSTAEESGRSVFINNLPVNVTASHVEDELKKFGTIKPSGVHVKIRQGGGSSYAFLEFEETASVQRAVDASPILIDGRQVFIRKKLPFGDGFTNGGERGRYGVQGNGRNDFVNNRTGGSISGRGGAFLGASRDGYNQREENRMRNGGRGSQQGATTTSKVRNPKI